MCRPLYRVPITTCSIPCYQPPSGPAHSPAKARQLLAEAGFPDGRGWIGASLDPVSFLANFITDGGNNRTGFSNARYDDIILRLAPTAESAEERLQLLREAETILINEVPIIPIYTYNSKHLVHPSVRGAPANVLDTVNFRYVWLEDASSPEKNED